MHKDLTLLEIAIWDNEGGEEGGSEGSGDGEGGDDDGIPSVGDQKPGTQRTFTQKEVDEIVVKRNKKVKAQLQSMEKSYESLLKQQNLNAETREQLEADLENVRSQMRTKEEQLRHEQKQAERQYKAQLEEAQKEALNYKTMFESSTIERSILDAAAGEAYDPEQFVVILGSKTKLVDELTDTGEKTGKKVAKVDWEIDVEDDDGKTRKQTIVISPQEAIEKMKEQKRYHNLFKSNVAAGLGGGTTGPGNRGRLDVKNMSVEEYAEFRKTPEGKKALGLRR